ncbi:MAG: hypothetical protein AAFR21_14620 [Pseudomonadota bacterium]
MWKYIGITVLIIVIWMTIGVVSNLVFGKHAGTIGDSFGVVNSLFSGLALAGVVVAIVMQSAELRYQRAELALTRTELKRTADAQESSQFVLSEQARLSFLSSYLQALNVAVSTSNDDREEPVLQRAQARIRSMRLRYELDSLINSLDEEYPKHVSSRIRFTPKNLLQLEKILLLAEQLNELAEFEVKVQEKPKKKQLADFAYEVNERVKKIGETFDEVAKFPPTFQVFRALSQEADRFREWRDKIWLPMFNKEEYTHLATRWTKLIHVRLEVENLALSASYDISNS